METNVPHRDSSDQVTVQDAMGRAPLRQRFLAPVLVAGGIGLVLMAGNALASFVTSSVGTGSAVSATATPALDQVFSPNDNAAPTFADTMSALYSCLVNSQTCNANQRTAAIDMNNDGVISFIDLRTCFAQRGKQVPDTEIRRWISVRIESCAISIYSKRLN